MHNSLVVSHIDCIQVHVQAIQYIVYYSVFLPSPSLSSNWIMSTGQVACRIVRYMCLCGVTKAMNNPHMTLSKTVSLELNVTIPLIDVIAQICYTHI